MSKILVIRGGAIGDFILTLPVLSALRRHLPNARLEVLGYPHIAHLAVAGGLADEMRSIEARPLANFFARPSGPGHLDAGLLEYFEGFAIILSYLYDPDQVFQTNVQDACRGQFIVGPHRPDETKARHATEAFLEPLQRVAIFDADPVPRLKVRSTAPGIKQVALHPGSGSERKNWPLLSWIAFAQQLAQQGVSILLVGGEAEADKLKTMTEVLNAWPMEVAFDWPLSRLAERLGQCAAFVGHDSGITHLAAALGIPTVALWGETARAVWRPLGDHVKLLQHTAGLSKLAPQEVLAAVSPLVPF